MGEILCRCDHQEDENGRCLNCRNPIFERSDVLLHDRPTPEFSKEPRVIPADPEPYTVCPECGADKVEHSKTCSRHWYNVNRYVPPLVRS